MTDKTLLVLRCISCEGKLKVNKEKERLGKHLVEGELKCTKCKKKYPVRNAIPRFVKDDMYVSSFSFEWQTHKQTQLDSVSGDKESDVTFFEKTTFTPKELKGKLVLDVGSGSGRFSEVVLNHGGSVIGVDLSYAVDAARGNFPLTAAVDFVQADIFNLPFAPESFDLIFSIGVLHHTKNTKQAFMMLPKLLKKKGKVAIWLYSLLVFRYYVMSEFLRKYTSKMNQRLLYWLSHIAVPYYHLVNLRFVGPIFALLLPTSTHPKAEWRVLDTFDWYSPTYQWKHTTAEVFEWYKEAGLSDLNVGKHEVSVCGTRT